MDVQHLDYDDESLVRAALQAAYPSERPVFSQRRGAQIIHAAATHALEEGDRRRPFVVGRIAALAAVAFALFAGTAGAASAALPGERLYPIKHVVERAMVAVAGDDIAAARLELRFAERRLQEASAIHSDSGRAVDPSLSRRFHEHLAAAASLAGDDVAGEVEQLEQSSDAQQTGRGDAALPVEDTQPAQTVPPDEPGPDDLGSDEPVVTASPTPSASPAPDPSPTPLPTVSPSPAPSPGGTATPAEVEPGDAGPHDDTTPSPSSSPEAPSDQLPGDGQEQPIRADAPSR